VIFLGVLVRVLVVSTLPLIVGVACAIRGPTPLPRNALGCYRVSAEGWTEETGKLVGFGTLPEVVALHTLRSAWESIVLVPRDWSWQSWNKINFASWSSTTGEWLLLPGDTIVMIEGGSLFHKMALDSIVVAWRRLGSVTAFLGVTVDGYAGFAQIEPREMARDLPPLWVELERMQCADWSGSPLVDPRSLAGA
jgi:hypothetical protein